MQLICCHHSKIQDISKFRSTVSNNNEQKHPTKNQRTMLPSKLRSLSASKSNPTEIQAQEKSRSDNHPQRMLSSVPESPRLYQNAHRLFHQRAPIAATTTATHVSVPTRDDYLCKQMPKKTFTMIPKQTASSREKYPPRNAATAATSPSPSQPHKFVHGYQTPPSVSMPISTRRQTKLEHVPKPTRHYERKLPDPGKLAKHYRCKQTTITMFVCLVVEQPPLTPRFTLRKFAMPPPPQQRSMTHGNYLGRTRSDTTATTTTTSSSDEDEPNEEPLFTTYHHRSYSSNTAAGTPLTFDHYTNSNNSPLFHRYNKTMEYKSLSSPRLRVMCEKSPFYYWPNDSYVNIYTY